MNIRNLLTRLLGRSRNVNQHNIQSDTKRLGSSFYSSQVETRYSCEECGLEFDKIESFNETECREKPNTPSETRRATLKVMDVQRFKHVRFINEKEKSLFLKINHPKHNDKIRWELNSLKEGEWYTFIFVLQTEDYYCQSIEAAN